MKKGMEKETGKEARAPLSLDEFRRVQNNFWMYFADGFVGDLYRKKAHYQKFVWEHSELESKLKSKIKEVNDYLKGKKKPPGDSVYRNFFGLGWDGIASADVILPIYEDLYEAYKIMRTYVGDDGALFD